MPKSKSKQQQHLNNKQKKLITARLMQISFKIDDYVYKNKPIAEDEAKLYMKEVEAYKVTCYKDERSLQVIEKLTRYMNAIISEHHEAKNINSENPSCVSPVYPICDEDLTQFTPTEEPLTEVNDNENKNDNITSTTTNVANLDCIPNVQVEIHEAISNLSLKDTGEVIKTSTAKEDCSPIIYHQYNNKDQNNKAPISISNKTDITERNSPDFFNKPLKVTNPIITSKVTNAIANEINTTLPHNEITNSNSIPNVNIKIDNAKNVILTHKKRLTTDKFNTTSVTTETNHVSSDLIKNVNNNFENEILTDDCSQSILKEYSHNIANTNKNTAVLIDANLSIRKHKPMLITNNKDQKQTTFSHNPNANLTTPSNLVTINATHGINAFQNQNLLQKSIQLNKELPQRVNTPIFKIRDSQNSQQLTHQGKIPSTKVTIHNLAPLKHKTTINNHHSLNENSNIIKKKRAPKKKKLDNMPNVKQSFNPNLTDLNYAQTVKGRRKAIIIPLNNKAVENDLSWLEVIRCVREVKDDENVTLREIKDTFWENYSLPADWNKCEYF